MYITYLRSSSYGSWDQCHLKYYLTYTLGLPDKSNIRAALGNVCHKILEGLALRKLAEQNGVNFFDDDECFGHVLTRDATPEKLFLPAYEHYRRIDPEFDWREKPNKREILGWVERVQTEAGGAYDPLRRTIISPEQTFDFALEEDWAAYEYVLKDGRTIKGQLGIKGTSDLVTDLGDGVIEFLDWKTGKRKKWPSGEVKDYDYFLYEDFQLKLYFLALAHLFPEAKTILTTIFYTADYRDWKTGVVTPGGPFTVVFERDQIPEIKQIIRKRFEEIKRDNFPLANRTEQGCKYCHYRNTNWKDGEKSTCDFFADLVQLNGADSVFAEYGNEKTLNSYKGGGRQSWEKKE